MKLLVSGARGFVGSALTERAELEGHTVVALTRHPKSEGDIGWNPQDESVDRSQLAGFDAVVHLAGESIAEGRWNAAKKKRILDSRVDGTSTLADALAALPAGDRPQTFVSASAIGYYGNRGHETLDEQSSPGQLFLSSVCKAWEAASIPARDAGIRVVNTRLGVILHPTGGALSKMLTPFRMGVGGVIGDGQQYWSWISLSDVVGAILHCVNNESLAGPVNLVAPNPVTNQVFTKALGRALRRPTVLPMPGFAAKLALGEMATELLLASARVLPNALRQSEYTFQDVEIGRTLHKMLNA